MGVPDHLTCPLRNLNENQEAIVGTGHGTTDRFKIGKRAWILEWKKKKKCQEAMSSACTIGGPLFQTDAGLGDCIG